MTRVSVLLTHYSNIEITLDCIDSLMECDYADFNLIITDNSLQDQSRIAFSKRCETNGYNYEVISSENILPEFGQKIYWLQSKENLGYGGGMNLAAKFAAMCQPDLLVILNDDTIVGADFFSAINSETMPILNQPDFGFATGLINTYPSDKIWYAGGRFNRNRCMGEHIIAKPENMGIKETGFITGCLMICRPNCYQELKGFDESYFLYFEDVDLSLRAQQSGYKLYFLPKIKLWHRVGSSTGGDETETSVFYSTRNRLWLMARYYSGLNLLRFYLFFFSSRFLKMIKWGFIGKHRLYSPLWKGIRKGVTSNGL